MHQSISQDKLYKPHKPVLLYLFQDKEESEHKKLRLSSLQTAAAPATARASGPRRRRATSTPGWWRRWGRHRHLSLTSSGRRRRSRYKKTR